MNRKYHDPEWLKVNVAAFVSSLSSSEVFRVCMTGEVESVHIVKAGKRKGVRLVNKASLDRYIRSYLPGGERYRAKEQEGARV